MKEKVISSISEYIDFVEEFKGNAYFRGQADSSWLIQPNIFRDTTKLNNEVATLNSSEENNTRNILYKMLETQHYGAGTRLCDLTVNPLVALYFSIEDETMDLQDASVFIVDKTKETSMDSDEIRILLILATNSINTIKELKEICSKAGIIKTETELSEIIQRNYIINHNIELSYSNNRAMLQGGTGILFGFDIENNLIKRNGSIDLSSLLYKIIIPKTLKAEIRNWLKNYGICKSVLYDELKNNTILSYTVSEEIGKGFSSHKHILNIVVSDIVFGEKDIQKIVDEIFSKYSNYPSNTLVFAYIYYDEQDKRSYNWIAMPQLRDRNITLKYNFSYHKKRMTYINNEISITDIIEATEPIVKKCRETLNKAEKLYKKYLKDKITADEYKKEMSVLRKEIYKIVYFDLQDIEHSSAEYDDYYNSSNNYCIDVDTLIENQISFVDNSNKYLISKFWDSHFSRVETEYKKYSEAYKIIKKHKTAK